MSDRLQQFVILENKRPPLEAVPFAREILASSPLEGSGARGWSSLRRRALDVLKRSGAWTNTLPSWKCARTALPDDRQITLALAEAVSLTDPEKSAPFFEKAGLIAPLNVGLDLKLASSLAGNGHAEEAMDLYDGLLAQYLDRTIFEAKTELVPLYLQQNALTRLTNHIAEGFDAPVRDSRAYTTIFAIDRLADDVLKSGDEENAITLLKLGLPPPHSLRVAGSNEHKDEEPRLLDLLIKHGRQAEALVLFAASHKRSRTLCRIDDRIQI